uniref:Metalloendopeptidase n=1 Tax=Tetranychus urticae TaxID=32264 RepID=T1K4I4_TETUR
MIKNLAKFLLLIYLVANNNSVSGQTWFSSLKQFGNFSNLCGHLKSPNNQITGQDQDKSSCNKNCRIAVKEAISDWERYTCIKFLDWGDDEYFDEDEYNRFYIKFRADQPGCFTVFRKNNYHLGQSVNLGDGCLTKTKILHELGHVLHLDHVHGRPDHQYELRSDLWEQVPYDYRSIMHYQSSDFSVSPFKLITMSTRSPNLQYLIDEPRQGLSFYDIKQVNLMYNCTYACPSDHFCLNQGISLPNLYYYNINEVDSNNNDFNDPDHVDTDEDGCSCLCPPAFVGPHCEISKYKTNYAFDQMIKRSGASACGNVLKSEGSIQTQDYPKRSKPFDSCSWIINAPKGYRIELFFVDFWFDEPTTYLNYYENRCASERVEIRCNDPYEPEM